MEKNDRKALVDSYKNRLLAGGVFLIRNEKNGKVLLQQTPDLRSMQNRFAFSQSTDGCIFMTLQQDWKEYGGSAFHFEVLEEVKQQEIQTKQEFLEELAMTEEVWREKLADSDFYR